MDEQSERIRVLESALMPFAYAWQRYLEIGCGDSWLEYVNKHFDGKLMSSDYKCASDALGMLNGADKEESRS